MRNIRRSIRNIRRSQDWFFIANKEKPKTEQLGENK
tara:strand:+ start:383 stop:490 length:108 start_codon:yes stop_codon:yes gene_type:complete